MLGSAPGELHEIGTLMISILLREAGYRVEFLGPDLPLDDLALYAKDEKPKMIILSATLKESVADLAGFDALLEAIHPKPIFGFGGPAFNRHPELISQTPGVFLGKSFSQSLETVRSTLEDSNKKIKK
jgi:methanogenic corrinoid protein MtbC1